MSNKFKKIKNIIGPHSHSHPNEIHKLTFEKQKMNILKIKKNLPRY